MELHRAKFSVTAPELMFQKRVPRSFTNVPRLFHVMEQEFPCGIKYLHDLFHCSMVFEGDTLFHAKKNRLTWAETASAEFVPTVTYKQFKHAGIVLFKNRGTLEHLIIIIYIYTYYSFINQQLSPLRNPHF